MARNFGTILWCRCASTLGGAFATLNRSYLTLRRLLVRLRRLLKIVLTWISANKECILMLARWAELALRLVLLVLVGHAG